MCKVVSFFQKYLQTIVTLGSIIGAMIMWFVTMSNIPHKVAELEHKHQVDYEKIEDKFSVVNNKVDGVDVRLRVAEVNIEKNSTKSDLTLQGVIEIRQLLLNKK